MNTNELAQLICKAEGKRKQVNIAQVKEILGVISEICYFNPLALALIIKNGVRRAPKVKERMMREYRKKK